MVQPVLVLAARIALGLPLSIVFSVMGIGIVWGLYIFITTGVASQTLLLSLFIVGAGVGAGLGGFFAWLRIDGDTWPVVITTLALALLAGVGGAWGGYEYGGSRDVPCCAQPTMGPLTYAALGATVVANAVAMASYLIRSSPLGRRHSKLGGLHS